MKVFEDSLKVFVPPTGSVNKQEVWIMRGDEFVASVRMSETVNMGWGDWLQAALNFAQGRTTEELRDIRNVKFDMRKVAQ